MPLLLRFLLALSALAAPAKPETVTLQAGETRLLAIPQIARLVVGAPEVAQARIFASDAVQLQARGAGKTHLLVWQSDGRRREVEIVVVAPPPAAAGQPAVECTERPSRPEAAKVFAEAGALFKQQRYAEARAAFERVLRLQPSFRTAHMYVGACAAATGDTRARLQAYRAFLEACPDHPMAGLTRRLLKDYQRWGDGQR